MHAHCPTERVFHIFILLFFNCLAIATSQQQDYKPLVFRADSHSPQRLKIFWNPRVPVKQIIELSSRDIRFNHSTVHTPVPLPTPSLVLQEHPDPWRTLVTERDNDDGTKRYIFLKMRLCDEVDWRVKWSDALGGVHGPIIQRLSPSPIPWSPRHLPITLNAQSMRYDSMNDAVYVNVNWTADHVQTELNLPSQMIEPIKPEIELGKCQTLFREPQPPPTINDNGLISIPSAYAKHGCSFSVRLTTMLYDPQLQCRLLYKTDDFRSLTFDLHCGTLPGLSCPTDTSSVQPCKMDCNPRLHPMADYRYLNGVIEPHIRLRWTNNQADAQVHGALVRLSQVDRTHLNFPIKEFNVSIIVLNPEDKREISLLQYNRDEMSSYKIQVCTLLSESCAEETPFWSKVPQRAVFFNELINQLPPPSPIDYPQLDGQHDTDSEEIQIARSTIENLQEDQQQQQQQQQQQHQEPSNVPPSVAVPSGPHASPDVSSPVQRVPPVVRRPPVLPTTVRRPTTPESSTHNRIVTRPSSPDGTRTSTGPVSEPDFIHNNNNDVIDTNHVVPEPERRPPPHSVPEPVPAETNRVQNANSVVQQQQQQPGVVGGGTQEQQRRSTAISDSQYPSYYKKSAPTFHGTLTIILLGVASVFIMIGL